jgi:hypothetical protein
MMMSGAIFAFCFCSRLSVVPSSRLTELPPLSPNHSSNVDRLASVQAKVDIVKSTMADNIEQMLVNSEKLEHIQSNAENLNEQAAVFKNRSTQL